MGKEVIFHSDVHKFSLEFVDSTLEEDFISNNSEVCHDRIHRMCKYFCAVYVVWVAYNMWLLASSGFSNVKLDFLSLCALALEFSLCIAYMATAHSKRGRNLEKFVVVVVYVCSVLPLIKPTPTDCVPRGTSYALLCGGIGSDIYGEHYSCWVKEGAG